MFGVALLGHALLLGALLAAAPPPAVLRPLLRLLRPLLRAFALHGAMLGGYLVEPVLATLACAYSGARTRTTALGLLHAARTLAPMALLPAFGATFASRQMEWALWATAALVPLVLRLPGMWHVSN